MEKLYGSQRDSTYWSVEKPSRFCLNHNHTIVLLTLVALLPLQACSSGVFELELIDLQRFDLTPPKVGDPQTEPTTGLRHNIHPIRVFVCLKEAFTSQLDEPCTFGNASITLSSSEAGQQREKRHGTANNRQEQTNQTVEIRDLEQKRQDISLDNQPSALGQQNQNHTPTDQQQQQQQQGSSVTDVVRIPFTFRWTKSFTIILTTEQISTNDQQLQQQQYQSSVNKVQFVGGQRRFAQISANSSANNKTTPLGTNNEQQLQQHQPLAANRSTLVASTDKANQHPFIDRHVLTENEVLPNVEANPSKPWTSRFSRSLKSSLFYRFRVFCALNYYGDGCTTFCRPRDDQFGHYNCSSTGQKVCHEGWHGPDCDKAKCRAGCNQQHGFCDKPDTCQCRPGWSGLRCDECITYPGCQNGYCLSPWQCICQKNWGGVLCDQDLNVCGTHDPCVNNGTCQNIAPGRYRCHCSEGFTGTNCESTSIPSSLESSQPASMSQFSAGCATNPCLNGGTCYGFNDHLVESSSGRDISSSMATEEHLELSSLADLQHPEPQFNDGRHYRCQCATGWTGDYCQWPDSLAFSTTENLSDSHPDVNVDGNSSALNWTTTQVINATSETVSQEDTSKNEQTDKISTEFITHLLEPNAHHPTTHLDMKHLISGVVIASVVGVFLASLLLAWCCLIAIERNRFSFIQMNIVRGGGGAGGVNGGGVDCESHLPVSSTLWRMHEKLRNSLRCSSRSRIKPETKLSIENVLKPPLAPPSYEESNYKSLNHIDQLHQNKNSSSLSMTSLSSTKQIAADVCNNLNEEPKYAVSKNILVKRGAIEQEMAQKKLQQAALRHQTESSEAKANHSCPRHGALYIKQSDDVIPTTTIEIEYQPRNQRNPQRHDQEIEPETNHHIQPHEHYHHPADWAQFNII